MKAKYSHVLLQLLWEPVMLCLVPLLSSFRPLHPIYLHPLDSSCLMSSVVSVSDMTLQFFPLLWSHINYLSPSFLTCLCVISASLPLLACLTYLWIEPYCTHVTTLQKDWSFQPYSYYHLNASPHPLHLTSSSKVPWVSQLGLEISAGCGLWSKLIRAE